MLPSETCSVVICPDWLDDFERRNADVIAQLELGPLLADMRKCVDVELNDLVMARYERAADKLLAALKAIECRA